MILNMSGGGGNPLNFKIVNGTSAPASPKENTIWVKTSTAITSWDFSATQPCRRSRNKNLSVFPYVYTTRTISGVVFTDNDDGTITVNGKATEDATFRLQGATDPAEHILLAPGTYTISDAAGSAAGRLEILVSYDDGENWSTIANCANGAKTFTITQSARARMNIKLYSGNTFSNVVFKPQLEKGSSATTFVQGSALGQVWINIGTSATAPINALKKNGIIVYPIAVKQYVSRVWSSRDAQTYQHGKWVEWIPAGLLYDKGDQITSVTGGWYTPVEVIGKVTYNEKSITVAVTNNEDGYIQCATKNKIDLTDYKTIKVNVTNFSKSGTSTPKLTISSKVGAGFTRIAEKDITATGEFSLDVSTFNSEYYVSFYGYWATNWSMTFDKVWME